MSNPLNDFMESIKFLPKEQGREKLRRFYKSTTRKLGLEYIMITDDEIKAKDFSAVIKFFGRFDKSWRAYQGKVMLNIDGYNDVAEELFEIPEVVAFFKELYLAHPHYLIYLDKPTESFDLAVRFLADDVEMQDASDAAKEFLDKVGGGNRDNPLYEELVENFALFQSTMGNDVFSQLTKGLLDWFGERDELETAFSLLKRISDAVVLKD